MGDSATSLPDWLSDGMDPNSSYLLRIKLVGNKRKARQEFSCYSFTKVVDADTTNFKDFVESIVNEFPPRYKEVAIVQYYDDASKTFPEVKTDQDMLSMFEKHGKTKIVCMTVAYYNPLEEAPQLVTEWIEWTPSPLGKRHSDAKDVVQGESQESKSVQNEEDDTYLANPLSENEHVGVDDEAMYLGKEPAHAVIVATVNDSGENEEDSEEGKSDENENDSDSCSDFEEEEDLVGNDPLPDNVVNMDYDKDNPPMEVGCTYPNMEEFRLALSQHAIKNEFEYNMQKSEPGRYTAYCSRKREDNCPWRIHASTMGDGVTIKVKKKPAAHDCTSRRRAKKVKNATKFWVCEKVKDWLIEDATLGAKELQRRIKDDHKVMVHYKRVYMGKQLALHQLYGDWDCSFDNLYRFKAAIEKSSPGSLVLLDHHTIQDKIRFRRSFFALKPCIDGFLTGCRPYLAIDNTFLTGRFKGQLGVAVAVDGHNWMYPVAFGVMDSETNENWIWFMQRLREAIGCPIGLAICTDYGQAVMAGVKEVFPNAEYRECMFHLVQNFKKRWSGKVFDDHLWAAAYSWHPYFFQKHWGAMEAAKPAAMEYLRKCHTRLWTRSQFSTRCKVDYVTNNLAESFNSWIKHHKSLNLDDFMDKIRQLLMIKWEQRRTVSRKLEGLILPHIVKKLKERSRNLDMEVVKCSNEVGEISVMGGSGIRFVVKLHEKTCSCREWQVSGITCVHAISFITSLDNEPLENYVDLFYSIEKFQAAYAQLIPALDDKSQWPKSNHGFFMHPPLLKSVAGRRQVQRFRSCTEGKNSTTRKKGQHQCPICKGYGHHWHNCKNGDPNDIAAMKAVRGTPKKRKRATKALTDNNVVPFDDEEPAPRMAFPLSQNIERLAIEYPDMQAAPNVIEKKKAARKEKAKENVRPNSKSKKMKTIVLHDSPAMCTRSKRVEPPSPAMATRSRRRLSL